MHASMLLTRLTQPTAAEVGLEQVDESLQKQGICTKRQHVPAGSRILVLERAHQTVAASAAPHAMPDWSGGTRPQAVGGQQAGQWAQLSPALH